MTGAENTYNATIEYTFPLDFAELVWSDGTHVEHQVINLTDTTPFGTKTFKIRVDAKGEKIGTICRMGLSGRWSLAPADRTKVVASFVQPNAIAAIAHGEIRPASSFGYITTSTESATGPCWRAVAVGTIGAALMARPPGATQVRVQE
jgi:hypothetical protein